MKIWYLAAIKHNKELDDGMMKQVTEQYLLDAVSYTDAESRAYEFAEEYISGAFSITKITKTNIGEVVINEDSDRLWKCKTVFQTVDGDSEKLININNYILVDADNAKQAFERIEQHMSGMQVPYDVPSIVATKIVEVVPYEGEV